MAKLPNTRKVAHTAALQFCIGYPEHLWPYSKKKNFIRSLGTDKSRHRERYAECVQEWKERCATYQTLADADLQKQREDNPELLAWQENDRARQKAGPVRHVTHLIESERRDLDQFVARWVAHAMHWHDETISECDDDEIADTETTLAERLEEIKLCVRRMRPSESWIDEVDDHMSEWCGFVLATDCPDRKSYLMRLLVQEMSALEASLSLLAGKPVETPLLTSSLAKSPPTDLHSDKPNFVGPRLHPHDFQTCFDNWKNAGQKKQSSIDEFRNLFVDFANFVIGKEAPLKDVSTADIQGKKHIIKWLEHVAHTKQIKRGTLKKHLQAISAILGNAFGRGEIEYNPALGIDLDSLAIRGTTAQTTGLKKDNVHPFTADEIRQYFSRLTYWTTVRTLQREVAYWFPLFLFAFGARPEEIATLMQDDVRIDSRGQYWIHIYTPTLSPNGLIRKPKHEVSYRHIPLPRHLMQLGFAEYFATRRPGDWLFPCKVADAVAAAEQEEGRSAQTLNDLGDYLREVAEITNEKKVTYSLRHTFKDELRRRAVPKEVSDALTGHAGENSNAGEAYYGSQWYPEEPLLEAMDKLQHFELLPEDFPTWAQFRDALQPTGPKRGRPPKIRI
ncbi:hypothetical protein [Paraburkholderia sp. J12]|uniref:hypothetical protein n=1 Tax=Paraburkholderia sp. J12 TaxID=2805432 RepID=UPI002ABD3449|nr:hypothetical protein [Paraburkholderia sp. J12]